MHFYFLKKAILNPSGGHKHIRLIASRLRELGVCAELVFIKGDKSGDWSFGMDIVSSVLDDDMGQRVHADDVVVLPENRPDRYLALIKDWPCRRAILNQNFYYALKTAQYLNYRRSSIDFVIATTPLIAKITYTYMGLPSQKVAVIPPIVDRCMSCPDTYCERLPMSVAYMPRKLPSHCESIRGIVARWHPDVTWIPIQNVEEQKLTEILRRTEVFLSTQDEEGFGSPAIEAMDCGCIVAGYRGMGRFPSPYATADNGFWARDRCISEAAACLDNAISICRRGGALAERYRAAGKATAGGYTRASFNAAVGKLRDAAKTGIYEFEPPSRVRFSMAMRLDIMKILWTRYSHRLSLRRLKTFLPK